MFAFPTQCHIKISAAYGSMKDMSVYSTLGLAPNQIYIVGRSSKKHQQLCQVKLYLCDEPHLLLFHV